MFLLYFLFWIIFNGAFTLEIAIFGVAISAGMYAFCCIFMGYSVKKDIAIIKKVPRFLYYIVILVWEIIKANAQMAKYIVIKQEYELKPVIFKYHTSLKTKVCRVLLSNSITLTPGTITISLKDDELIVNAIDKSFVFDDDGSFIFERLLSKLETGGDEE